MTDRPAGSLLLAQSEGSASGRLERSRDALRLAMRGRDVPVGRESSDAFGSPHRGWAGSLRETVRAVPGADVVMDVLSHWWANHPLHSAATVAGEAARGLAGPTARRNPVGLVVGALVCGALMVRLKPWRWLPRTLLFAGLLPQLASRLVAAVPLETWLNAFMNRAERSSTGSPADRGVGKR